MFYQKDTIENQKAIPDAVVLGFFPWTTEWLSLGGTSVDRVVQAPAKADSPRAGCTQSYPGRF